MLIYIKLKSNIPSWWVKYSCMLSFENIVCWLKKVEVENRCKLRRFMASFHFYYTFSFQTYKSQGTTWQDTYLTYLCLFIFVCLLESHQLHVNVFLLELEQLLFLSQKLLAHPLRLLLLPLLLDGSSITLFKLWALSKHFYLTKRPKRILYPVRFNG